MSIEPEEYVEGEISYFITRSQLSVGANYERMIHDSDLLMKLRASRLGVELSNLGFGITLQTDGDNFILTLIAENKDGIFSLDAKGCIDGDGLFQFNSFEFKVEVDDGVDVGEWLNGLQTSLDVYSMGDQGIGGAIASVISASIDIYKGDYGSAAIGILSAIPIIGIIGDAAKAGKIASQATETGMKYGAKFGSLADDVGVIYKDEQKFEKMGKAIGNMSGNRIVQKKQIDALTTEYNLSKVERKKLHKYIHGEGYGYKEIEEIIKNGWYK